MSKTLKKIICVFAVVCLITAALPICAFADSANITASSNSVSVGDIVTLTVKYKADFNVYAAQYEIKFDESLFKCTSSLAAVSEGTARWVDYKYNGEKDISLTATFLALATGKGNFSFRGDVSGDSTGSAEAAKAITVKKRSEDSQKSDGSSDASLVSLKVSGAELLPAFSSKTTNYSATVKNDVKSVDISATAVSGATFIGTGKMELKEGSNEATVTVTAEDGRSKKTYTVLIHRLTEEESKLIEDPTNPLHVTIDGKDYTIVANIAALGNFKDYEIKSVSRGGIAVETLADKKGKYNLYYLSNLDGESFFCNLNKNYKFEKICYLTFDDSLYIVEDIDKSFKIPKGYKKTALKLESGTANVIGYENSKLSNSFILYCYYGGESHFYRYNKSENTIQRADDFEEGMKPLEITETKKQAKEMKATGKLVIFLLILAFLALAAIITLCVMYYLKQKKKKEFSEGPPAEEYEEHIFDTVIEEDESKNDSNDE